MRNAFDMVAPQQEEVPMGYGIRNDLREQFDEAFRVGRFVWPKSKQEAGRMRKAWRRGDLVRLARRVYALREQLDTLNPVERELYTIRTLAALYPSWVFSHTSAAVVHNLEVGYGQLGTIHVACNIKSHTRSRGNICRHVINSDSFAQVDGINVTSLERTTFDCMRTGRFPRALAIADSALRKTGKDVGHFVEAFERLHGAHENKRRPIEIMAYADGRAENGGESVARASMIKLGYEVPDLQVEVPNLFDRTQPYRVDFYWDLKSGPVAGELDGHNKYVDHTMTKGKSMLEVFSDERLRESRISGSDVRVMRFSYTDVRNYKLFGHLLDVFGIPGNRPVPPIALT